MTSDNKPGNRARTIFLIDDEESMRISVAQWLSLSHFSVETFSDGASALNKIDDSFDGVIISDIRMPGMDGLELLSKILKIDSQIPVVLITGHGDIPMAVSAMRQGAYDFLEKPFDPEILLETVKRAWEMRHLILENQALKHQLEEKNKADVSLLGNSEPLQTLQGEITDLGPTDASVLLVGETGSGKEVVARCLHEKSERRGGPFVAINCGAIPENLFESELFGHEAGAFTGAQGRRIGKFEQADGGTLFLDEITSMPLNLQVKVLRVLQEKEIERLGGSGIIPINFRVISATNHNPRQACAEGAFREDLYYRLNLAELHLPPLRKRGGDIILLFEYFLLRARAKYDRESPSLSSEIVMKLMSHNWPGNVRELKNAAERFVLSSLPAEERISFILQQLDANPPHSPNLSLKEQAEHFERCLLEQALQRNKGNIQMTMKELDLPRRTLNQKMQNHGLTRKKFMEEEI